MMHRYLLALTAVAFVAGCAERQWVETFYTDLEPGVVPDFEVSEERRQSASRVGQLETPLERRPEETGAPPPAFRSSGLDVDRHDLVAAGIDVNPNVRVWTRNPDRIGRQVYGVAAPEVIRYGRPVAVGPVREPAPPHP